MGVHEKGKILKRCLFGLDALLPKRSRCTHSMALPLSRNHSIKFYAITGLQRCPPGRPRDRLAVPLGRRF
jgi:hypothetical protein